MSDKLDVQQVYILHVQKLSDEVDFLPTERNHPLGRGRPVRNRPQGIPFSTIDHLKWHLCSLIMKGLYRLDTRFQETLKLLWETRNWDKMIEVWRVSQYQSSRSAGFDAYWEDEPQVVL